MENKAFPFVHNRVIAFGETDAAGIVYTPNFSEFCMAAAEIWFREYLSFDWYHISTNLGLGSPVVRMEVDLFSPLKGSDNLAIEVLVDRAGVSSLTLFFMGRKMTPEGELVELSFTGKFVYCITSVEAGGSIPIPEAQLTLVNDYVSRCAEL